MSQKSTFLSSQDFWYMKLCPGVSGSGSFIFQFQGVQEEE